MSDYARDEGHPCQDWQGGAPYLHRPFSDVPKDHSLCWHGSDAEREAAELCAPVYSPPAGPTDVARAGLVVEAIRRVLRSYAIPESVAGNAARAVFQALQEPLG